VFITRATSIFVHIGSSREDFREDFSSKTKDKTIRLNDNDFKIRIRLVRILSFNNSRGI